MCRSLPSRIQSDPIHQPNAVALAYPLSWSTGVSASARLAFSFWKTVLPGLIYDVDLEEMRPNVAVA
jgi:hypothetical protein